jgi:hypothetical protein
MTGDKDMTVLVSSGDGKVEEMTFEEFLRRKSPRIVLYGSPSDGTSSEGVVWGAEVLDGDGNSVTTLTAEEAMAYLTAKPQ